MAGLLAKGTRSSCSDPFSRKGQVLVEQGIEPAIADVFDTDAVKAVLSRAQPENVIEQLISKEACPSAQSESSLTRKLFPPATSQCSLSLVYVFGHRLTNLRPKRGLGLPPPRPAFWLR